MSAIYHLKEIVKTRATNGTGFRLLIPSIRIEDREAIALVGYSGCGKSTLLDVLAMILRPDQAARFTFIPRGENPIDVAAAWTKRDQNRLGDLRKKHLGYVLQTGGLLPYLTVRDNINLSRRLLGMPEDGSVEHLAKVLGIQRQLDKFPGLLSAGERQRAAFARALAHRPSIVIADEPTASLDPITARKIMGAVMELVKEIGVTFIAASHDWAQIYKHDFRSLHQDSRERDGGRWIESTFKD
ncbi:MAG: ABC transporter ATP-binding protein [Gammaproteobacteria bacterium]